MKSFLVWLLSLVFFTCSMRYWQYDLKIIRIAAGQIFALVFDFFAVLYFLQFGKLSLPKGFVRKFVQLNYILFLVAILSGFFVDWSLDYASDQFLKNTFFLFSQVVFVTLMSMFLLQLRWLRITSLLKVYITGAVVSAAWCILEVTLAKQGIELNRIVFGAISTYREEVAFTFEWDFFFRATGFAGVNAQATYLMSVVPLLLVWQPYKKSFMNTSSLVLCLAGIMLTMSKNSILALIVSQVCLLYWRPKLFGARARRLLIAAIPLTLFVDFYWEEVLALFHTRVNTEDSGFWRFFSGRIEIALAALEAVFAQPLGYGLGQYYVHIMTQNTVDLSLVVRLLGMKTEYARMAYANPHNNWISWMFELGIWGFGIYLYYYIWVVRNLLKFTSALAGASAASVVGLMVAGVFNNTLDQFSVVIFITLTSVAVYCEAATNAAIANRMQTGPGRQHDR